VPASTNPPPADLLALARAVLKPCPHCGEPKCGDSPAWAAFYRDDLPEIVAALCERLDALDQSPDAAMDGQWSMTNAMTSPLITQPRTSDE
jgi:hypothetical protein